MSIADLPPDQLVRYGQALGLDVSEKTPEGELLRLIRERQELLDSIDFGVLTELIKWTRRAVHENASKEELAREIAESKKMTFDGLSQPALYALVRLRGNEAAPDATPEALTDILFHQEPWMDRFRRKRNTWLGGLIGKYVLGSQPGDAPGAEPSADYQFLPAEKHAASLREDIEDRGLIGGLTGRLRGAADDYIREKLDEIEKRIDRKLDEIDKRLGEWRDREIVNRLRIMKITLVASVIVAVISLVYNGVSRWVEARQAEAEAGEVKPADAPK